MSAVGLESIDHAVEVTHAWINDLDAALGWENKRRTYRVLRVVLQAIRDCLQTNEMADFAAQLPELIRGAYYEHWRPATTPVKDRHRAAFLERIDESFKNDPLVSTPDVVATVFAFLSRKISRGEIKDVRHALPADLRELWPAPSRAA